jgi:hypothetical protein
MLPWFVAWYVVLLLLSIGTSYTLDWLHGVGSIFSYWHSGLGRRFGSAVLAPLDLVLGYVQCLMVSLLATLLAWRAVSARQVTYLAAWLMPFTLLGGLFTVIYKPIWDYLGSPWPAYRSSELAFQVGEVGMELLYRGFDLVLGVFGGFAAATVLGRRRWIIVPATTLALVAMFPVYLGVHRTFNQFVYHPARNLLYGPPPRPTPWMLISPGPTFNVGTTDPVMAGQWTIEYNGAGDQPKSEMAFDDSGALVHYKQHDSSIHMFVDFIVDGQTHELESEALQGKPLQASYRVLSGCKRTVSRVVLRVRIELTVHREEGGTWMTVPIVSEETFTGSLDDNGLSIDGTSVLIQNAPGVQFEPPFLERTFIMERSTPAAPTE